MSFHKYFSAERDAAEHALVVASDAITGGLASFSTWLMAGSGAAFSLFIINIDKLASRLSGVAFQCALLFFAASLLAGLISRWMATSVASQLAVLELIKQRAADVDHHHFSSRAFVWFVATNSRWWVSRSIWRAFFNQNKGATPLMGRVVAQKSQLQSLFALAQMVFIVASVVALAFGIRLTGVSPTTSASSMMSGTSSMTAGTSSMTAGTSSMTSKTSSKTSCKVSCSGVEHPLSKV